MNIPTSGSFSVAQYTIEAKLYPRKPKLRARPAKQFPALVERRCFGKFFFERNKGELRVQVPVESSTQSQLASDAKFDIPKVLKPQPGGEADDHDNEATILFAGLHKQEGRGRG